MSNNRVPVGPGMIEAMKRQGMNQTQIAEATGHTRASISKIKLTSGQSYSTTARERANKAWPWRTTKEQTDSTVAKNLRRHAEYMESGGKGMSPDDLSRLSSFYRTLESKDAVVVFDPNIPPNAATKVGCFAYLPRAESDGNLIIRVNHQVVIDRDTIESVWSWPPRKPDTR